MLRGFQSKNLAIGQHHTAPERRLFSDIRAVLKHARTAQRRFILVLTHSPSRPYSPSPVAGAAPSPTRTPASPSDPAPVAGAATPAVAASFASASARAAVQPRSRSRRCATSPTCVVRRSGRAPTASASLSAAACLLASLRPCLSQRALAVSSADSLAGTCSGVSAGECSVYYGRR